MTTIGTLKQISASQMRGSLASSQRSVTLELEAIPANERQGEQSPDWRVFGIRDDGQPYELGGAWNKEMTEGQNKRRYLSLSLDDPDWKSPLHVAAFPAKGKEATFDVIWNRPQR